MNYNVDWDKTIENIEFLLMGRTHKNKFSEMFCVTGRQAENKISTRSKKGLSISELLMLSDYLECDVTDLVILEDDPYVAPSSDWREGLRKEEVSDKSPEDVKETINSLKEIKENYEIRNLAEFLLYLPLMEDEKVRDMVVRCYGHLTYDDRHYLMSQLSYLYKTIPDCGAKRDADACRNNLLRVKGVPGNNTFGVKDKDFDKYYYRNLERYLEDGNSGLWKYESNKEWIERRRKETLGL